MENNTPQKFYYKFNEYKYNDKCKDRVLSGIPDLDYLTKGFELGCITLWTGNTNNGKTTVMTMIAKRTIEQKEKVFFFNGEQTKDDFKNNIYKQSVTREKIYSKKYGESNIFDTFVNEEEVQRLNKLYGESLIVFNNEMPRNIKVLLYAMEECRAREGVRVFILDNFMQIDIQSENIYQEQTAIMEQLRTFAVNKNIHIHLVAHPRKVERLQNRLTLYDVAGSMNLANKAYNIISIMRTDRFDKESTEYAKLSKEMLAEKYDIENADSILEVLKTKGNACGLVGMQYDNWLKTYTPLPRLTEELYEKKKREFVNTKNSKSKEGDNPF